MIAGVFEELSRERPRNHFTVGIVDDVTHTSLRFDAELDIEPPDVTRAVFYGLGSDGTVGANKNSIKILGEETGGYAQGYFVYDSKKAGAVTISHLRFGPRPIRSAYLVRRAGFVACHQFEFVHRYDVLEAAAEGAAFLLNSPYPASAVWDELPLEMQEQIVQKKLRFFVVDAFRIAREAGLKGRINTIMQTCFFAITRTLPPETAIARIKQAISDTYAKKGPEVLKRNFAGVDAALGGLAEVRVPAQATATRRRPPIVAGEAPGFVQKVTALMLAGHGDRLPVSAFPVDGTWPTATAQWEKRNIATEIPVWDPAVCIQCNKCALVCPHAAIRAKVFEPMRLEGAPETFKSDLFRGADFEGWRYTIQVAPEDCTGCTLCVMFCPAKDKSNPKHKAIDMAPQRPLREKERDNYAFFLDLPEPDRSRIRVMDVKGSQFATPLFEYSGACAGCGETPYIKLLTQLFGDRTLIANATGCSSIYGGNLPTTPYAVDRHGRGPAWSNSLFEDNAEFGLGMRLGLDSRAAHARQLLSVVGPALTAGLAREILEADQSTDAGIAAQRERAARLRRELAPLQMPRRPRARDTLRRPREEDRLDRRRRRLGLRHRLRRARPRALAALRRQRAGARHRGLLEHGRSAVEGHAARSRRQVRRRRQGDRQEGPRPDGDELRPRLRRADRLRGKRLPDGQGHPGGRGLPRPVARDRLQPLHRARVRHGLRLRAAEAGRGFGRLAALPLRPAAHRLGRGAAGARLGRAEEARRGLPQQREPFPDAGSGRPGALQRLAARAGQEAERRLALYKHLSDWKLARRRAADGAK